MSFFTRISAVLLVALSYACGPAQKDLQSELEHHKLNISGSSTLAPLVAEIAKVYEQNHPGTRIDVQTGGSSRGISDLTQGLSDIGMVSRHIESTTAFQAHPIANDGVSLIVHTDNPLSSLTKQQINSIYQKRVSDWSELKGKTGGIVVVSKAEGRSTLEVFLQYLGVKHSALRPDTIIGDNEQAIKLVANNPQAIAYVSTSTAAYHINSGLGIKALQIDGIAPNIGNVANNSFPIIRQLNLLTSENSSPQAEEFIAFCQSPVGKKLIEEFHFVPSL